MIDSNEIVKLIERCDPKELGGERAVWHLVRDTYAMNPNTRDDDAVYPRWYVRWTGEDGSAPNGLMDFVDGETAFLVGLDKLRAGYKTPMQEIREKITADNYQRDPRGIKYGNEGRRRLVDICRELSSRNAPKPFGLDVRTAAEIIGALDPETDKPVAIAGSRALARLVRDGILEQTSRGQKREKGKKPARAEFKFIPPDETFSTQMAVNLETVEDLGVVHIKGAGEIEFWRLRCIHNNEGLVFGTDDPGVARIAKDLIGQAVDVTFERRPQGKLALAIGAASDTAVQINKW